MVTKLESFKEKNLELKEGQEVRLDKETIKGPVQQKDIEVDLDLSPEQKDEIANLIMGEIAKSKSDTERKRYINQYNKNRKRYMMDDSDRAGAFPTAMKRRTGGTTNAIDSLTPRIKSAFLDSGPVAPIRPQVLLHMEWL